MTKDVNWTGNVQKDEELKTSKTKKKVEDE